MPINLAAPYAKREVRFLERWEPDGWRIKCYGIAHPERGMPEEPLLTAAKDLATDVLAGADRREHHDAGFLIVHVAREAVFLLLDLWTGENMLRQRLFASDFDNPTRFRDLADSRLMACVWEIPVQSFESRAWVECVLDNPEGPNLAAYAGRQLNGRV